MIKHIILQKNYNLNQSGYQLKLPLYMETCTLLLYNGDYSSRSMELNCRGTRQLFQDIPWCHFYADEGRCHGKWTVKACIQSPTRCGFRIDHMAYFLSVNHYFLNICNMDRLVIAAVVCAFLKNMVSVHCDMNDYLPESTRIVQWNRKLQNIKS